SQTGAKSSSAADPVPTSTPKPGADPQSPQPGASPPKPTTKDPAKAGSAAGSASKGNGR
ncbi:MAG: hypothetical protein H0X17_01935, partial [Deltaproteobacteria bacterium]|nr:hypothetical protein [Deltaproteobacteria bacterium]